MKPALILCDENTFYRSLSMIIYFDQNMHQLIRLLLVYLLNKDNKLFEEYLDEGKNMNDIIKETVKLNSPVKEIHLYATARLIGRQINLYKTTDLIHYPVVGRQDSNHNSHIYLASKNDNFTCLL